MPISGSKQSLQIAKRNLSNFDENSVISFRIEILRAYKRSFHSILHAERIGCRFQRRNIPCKSQNAIFQISTKSLLFRSGLRYYGHINALSTAFYTPNVLHVDLSVEKIPANRKTQSFKFRRRLCYFVPD
jgi:hypothetical protein